MDEHYIFAVSSMLKLAFSEQLDRRSCIKAGCFNVLVQLSFEEMSVNRWSKQQIMPLEPTNPDPTGPDKLGIHTAKRQDQDPLYWQSIHHSQQWCIVKTALHLHMKSFWHSILIYYSVTREVWPWVKCKSNMMFPKSRNKACQSKEQNLPHSNTVSVLLTSNAEACLLSDKLWYQLRILAGKALNTAPYNASTKLSKTSYDPDFSCATAESAFLSGWEADMWLDCPSDLDWAAFRAASIGSIFFLGTDFFNGAVCKGNSATRHSKKESSNLQSKRALCM